MSDLEKENKPFVSKGGAYYRNEILNLIRDLSFKEKFNIIKKSDRELLKKLNTFNGTKAVHTLDYISKFPKKNKITLTEECILAVRSLMILWEKKEYLIEKKRKMIKLVK